MSRLHQMVRFPLNKKMLFLSILLALFGCYKNGIYLYLQGFSSFVSSLVIFLYPLFGYGIGLVYDILFKNKAYYPYRFYGLLFSLLIPMSTPIWLFVLFLIVLLLIYHFFFEKRDSEFHFLVFGKLLLVGLLHIFQIYHYENILEESHTYIYSFLDSIFGHHVSGLGTSFVFGLICSYLFLFFDDSYKKEIPLYSYGIYILSLLGFSLWTQDMTFLLEYSLSSTVLFALIFLEPLSSFSPYTPKKKVFYGVSVGVLILPLSLLFNFQEGIYFSLIFVNLLLIFINGLQKRIFRKRKA